MKNDFENESEKIIGLTKQIYKISWKTKLIQDTVWNYWMLIISLLRLGIWDLEEYNKWVLNLEKFKNEEITIEQLKEIKEDLSNKFS